MERKYLGESLSATKHFLQSLNTPNEQLRFKNTFEHSDLYRKLPPAERDFVYQRATEQKSHLEATTQKLSERRGVQTKIAVEELQDVMKTELLVLSLSEADPRQIKDRASVILEEYLGKRGNISVGVETRQLSQELSEIVQGRNTRKLQNERNYAGAKPPHDFDQNGSRHERLLEQTR